MKRKKFTMLTVQLSKKLFKYVQLSMRLGKRFLSIKETIVTISNIAVCHIFPCQTQSKNNAIPC